MARYVDKVTYELDLSGKLNNIVKSEVKQTLEEVGGYLVEQILENCGRAKTSVANGAWKSSLSPAYKKRKGDQSSSLIANMELTGDMLDSLTFKTNGKKIEIGIFDYNEAQKADNHNKFSGASKGTNVPQRQFIPRKGEKFSRDILSEINQIIEDKKNGSD